MTNSQEFPTLNELFSELKATTLIDSACSTTEGILSFSIQLDHSFTFPLREPFVFSYLPESCPGILTLRILTQEHHEIQELEISELIRSWNVKKRAQSFFSFSILPIEIKAFIDDDNYRSFRCQLIEAKYSIDDVKTLELLKLNQNALENDIAVALSQKGSTLPLIATLDLSVDEKILRLRQELIKDSQELLKRTSHDFLEELQRFLLAADKEFIRLRTLEHVTKIVRTHFWLRKNITQQSSDPIASNKRNILIRAFPGTLKYQFGERHFLSLVICISRLDDYERLKSSHLLEAFRSIIPDSIQVPQSFYSYSYSQDKAYSLYIELEKGDNSHYTPEELLMIREEMPKALISAIEPLVSKIDIPQNEEEHLRNILLLSQEIRSRKDTPQVIIQFSKQHAQALEFRITLMKLGSEGEAIHIDQISFPSPTEIIQFQPISASTVGFLRGKYPKQAISFIVYCSKKPFSRPNKSIDYVRAREFIVTAIESIFGQVRDVNGGLMCKQHQFIHEIIGKLDSHERREQHMLEDLFLNMTPPIMKSLVSSETILNLFRAYKKNAPAPHSCVRISDEEEPLDDFVAYSFIAKDRSIEHEITQKISALRPAEHDVAITFLQHEGDSFYQYFLLLRKTVSPWIQDEIVRFIKERIEISYQEDLYKKSIRISLSRPTLLLDPRIGTDRTSGIMIKMLYEGLMRLDPTGKPTYGIAEKIDISQDGTQYIFQLRESVWSNGKPLTAHDFEYAWKKILDPSFKTLFDYLFHPIKNAKKVKAGMKDIEELGVRALSNNTLLVELEMPTPYFLELCCHWIYSPLSKEVDEMHPGWAYYAEDTYVCNGPFRLTKWRRESEIQTVKNEHYWDKDSVNLDKIDISIIEDPALALSLFQRGHLDWIGEPLTEIPLEIIRSQNHDIQSHPISSVQWFALNVQHAPFQSKKVRHAFSLALDRAKIVQQVLRGDESLASSLLPKRLSQLEESPLCSCDIEKAKELFLEGLQESGLTPKDIPPLVLKVYDQEPHKSIAKAVIQMWEETFPITIKLEVLGWHRYFESIPEFSYDIIGIMWYSWFLDPMYTFETLSSLSNGMNLSQWQHPQFLSLFGRAQKETSPEKRKLLFRQIEEIVMEEMPVISVFEYTLRYMKNMRLTKIYLSHLGNIDFKWADLIEQ